LDLMMRIRQESWQVILLDGGIFVR